MSVSKQSDVPQQQYFYPQQHTVDLTQQERKALSLVWHDDKTASEKPQQRDVDTSHCAVLGYN